MLIPGLEGQKSSSPQRWRRGVRRYGLIMTKGPNIEINPARKSFNAHRTGEKSDASVKKENICLQKGAEKKETCRKK